MLFWNTHEKGIQKAEAEIQSLGIFIDRYTFDLEDQESFAEECRKIREGNYDGVLLVPFFKEETVRLTTHCQSNQIPFVYFDTDMKHDQISPLSFVGQDAFRSGYFAGKLASYFLREEDTALTVNIHSKLKPDNHINAPRREEGFKAFGDEKKNFRIENLEFREENKEITGESLISMLRENKSIRLIFVTNSRAHQIASVLEKASVKGVRIIGYDLTDHNISYLNKGAIDFLISQDPVNQAYQGIMTLYSHLILGQEVARECLMPIDLILKENLEFNKD